MSVKSQNLSRADRMAGFFQKRRVGFEDLLERYQVEIYAFSDRLRAIQPEQIGKTASGKRTDIVKSLAELIGSGQDTDHGIASVVLVSDGADTETLADVSDVQGLSVGLRETLTTLGTPVNTLLVEDDQDLGDLAITDVAAQEFGFIRNAMELEITVLSRGFRDGVELPVTLEQGGRTLASEVVRLPSNGFHKVKLRFVPDTVGRFAYRVRIPLLEGEINQENNSRGFISSVIRDKIRVLHVVGRPSWDQRFLRDVLRSDPNIDLVSFYILRSISDTPGVSEQELSLIPFPVDKLFGSEIASFDVVVFQNFNHAPYRVGGHLEQLADYVRGGGAFCMLGGDLSFGAGGYARTPLAEILPVGLQAGGDWRVEEFQAVPVKGSKEHPVMKVGKPAVWDRLPSLGSYHLVKSVYQDTQVLLAHPFVTVDDQPAPILALREVDRGRSAALLTDGGWRWAFRNPGDGGNPQLYTRFWNNLFRWLVRDPALSSVMLRSDKSHFSDGEPLRFRLRLHGSHSDAQEPNKAVRLIVRNADNGEMAQSKHFRLKNGHGIDLELPSPGVGAFVAGLEFPAGNQFERIEEFFFVEDQGPELDQSLPRPVVMKMIAGLTGGEYSRMHTANLQRLAVRETERYRVESSTTEPLLEQDWFLVFLLGSLGIEWWLRRYWGYA